MEGNDQVEVTQARTTPTFLRSGASASAMCCSGLFVRSKVLGMDGPAYDGRCQAGSQVVCRCPQLLGAPHAIHVEIEARSAAPSGCAPYVASGITAVPHVGAETAQRKLDLVVSVLHGSTKGSPW